MLAVGALLACLHCHSHGFSCAFGMPFTTSGSLQHDVFGLEFGT